MKERPFGGVFISMNIIFPLLILAALFVLPVGADARTEMMCTKEYRPVCGAKEVQCVRAPCYPQYATYGNACTLAAENGTFIHEGECTAEETGPVKPAPYVPPANCTAWFDGCNQCGRGESGESFCTLKACVDAPTVGYCTAYDEPAAPAKPAPAPSPSEPEPVATTSLSEGDRQGFFATLWDRIAGFFAALF